MNAVVDLLRIFGVLILGLLYLCGQGWLVAGPLVHGSLRVRKEGVRLLQDAPLAVVCGLLTNYTLILLAQSLRSALVIGAAAALLGLGCTGSALFRHPRSAGDRRQWAVWLAAALVALPALSPILAEALGAWDARSVWFFHARMMYVAGTIGPAAGWLEPTASFFAHMDYPKLVTSLAAQLMTALGWWNEYMPKAALFFLLAPALLWLCSLARRQWSAALLLLLPFGLSDTLWTGYMDGYLALFLGIAVLLLGRYAERSQPTDAISAACILLLLPNIKNEGALAALAGLPALAWLVLRRNDGRLTRVLSRRNWKYLFSGLLLLLPAALWAAYVRRWGMASDLQFASAGSIARLLGRLQDGSLAMILQRMWLCLDGPLLVLGVLLCAYGAWRLPLPAQMAPAALAGCIFAAGLVAVYLMTPYDVAWHLDTSMERVTLSINVCSYAASYFLLRRLEVGSSGV